MTHAELIAALEAATEPSWELDAEIARAIGAPVYPDLRAHRYTSSLDAALTLVPEGWCWAIEGSRRAAVYDPSADPEPGSFANPIQMRSGFTPAIALCVAALKARDAAP